MMMSLGLKTLFSSSLRSFSVVAFNFCSSSFFYHFCFQTLFWGLVFLFFQGMSPVLARPTNENEWNSYHPQEGNSHREIELFEWILNEKCFELEHDVENTIEIV